MFKICISLADGAALHRTVREGTVAHVPVLHVAIALVPIPHAVIALVPIPHVVTTLLHQTIPGARGAIHPHPRAIVTPSTPVTSLAATKMAIRLRRRTKKRRVRAEAREALKRQKRLDRPTNLEPNSE